ncbi:MAG: S9 family peptidase [Deltaproteobacteria bacterium]|nr:S9 family peptidase [Deltaproteobacteria bacterium]
MNLDFLRLYGETRGFSLGLPQQPTILADGKRVLFLRAEPKQPSLALFAYDLETKTERVLVTPETLLGGKEGELSVEEKARRERLRLTVSGVTSFAVSDSNAWLVIPLAGRVFLYRLADGRVMAPPVQGAIDPHLSPDDRHLAYVKDGDLYVWSLADERETRLTEGASEHLTHGLAEFVAQEEMQRMRGFWWSPDASRIAYAKVDTSALERFAIADPTHPEKEPVRFRYPRAGRANAEVRLFVTSIDRSARHEVLWDRAQFPYLARVTWAKAAPLCLLVQTRAQRHEVLLAADAAGATRTLLEEKDDAWINLDRSSPLWLADGARFLWVSEKIGAYTIEVRAADGQLERTLSLPGLHELLRADHEAAYVLSADARAALQVQALPLDGSAPRLLCDEAGERTVSFCRQHALFAETIATRERYRRVIVRSAKDGREVCELPRKNLEPPEPPRLEWQTAAGMETLVIRPRTFDEKKRYPVILAVYGGPHHNHVVPMREMYLREQWLADLGYIVVAADNRGTPRKGRAYERAIAGDFSQVALDDQIAALSALAKQVPQMDLDRVGVYGWSFGGYMAALSVLRRPDVFKRAVAGAPVVDWRDYDTHYTERYLGMPSENAAGYDRSSLLTYAKDLKAPLLLIHGTADDNVYFFHTLKLSDALTRHGVAHDVLPLAGFTHMVPEPEMLARVWQAIARHFDPLLTA